MTTERRTLMLFKPQHEELQQDARENNDAKLTAMFSAYQRGWKMLSPEQQFAALRGAEVNSANVAAPCNASPHDAANDLMRAVVDLDAEVDQAFKDGKITKSERNRLRNKADTVKKLADCVAVHANEPLAMSA